MDENKKYLITGVEDGWIKVNKATWDDYQYLKAKERMEIEQKLTNAKFALWQAENKIMKNGGTHLRDFINGDFASYFENLKKILYNNIIKKKKGK